MRNYLMVTAAAAALLAAQPATAEVVTLRYQGTLNSNIDWPGGVELTGFLTYDTDAAHTFTTATFRNYPIISHQVDLDGVVFDGIVSAPATRLQVVNDLQSGSAFQDQVSGYSDTDGTFETREVTGTGFQLFQQAASPPPALDSLEQPETDEDIAGFGVSRTIHVNYLDSSGALRAVFGQLTSITFVPDEPPLLITKCDGFAAPFDEPLSLPRKSSRALPLKISLLNENSDPLGPDDVAAPPVVSVSFVGAFSAGDPNEFVDSAGRATAGNAFVWDAETSMWTYNLGTRPFDQAGTYSVTVVAGDADYAISPTCSGTFVRE